MEQETSATVRWSEWIGEGWQMFAEKWQVWVVQMVVVFLTFAIPIVPLYLMMISRYVIAAQNGAPPELPPTFSPLVMALSVVGMLAGAFFWSGLHRTAFKQLRGEQISVRDLFSGGDIFLRVMGAFIVIGILAMVGLFLCIVPYFVVVGTLHFATPLIIERNLTIGEAIRTSYNTTKANWFMFVLFVLVLGLLAGLGGAACYVGLVASYPLYFTITAIAYRDIFGVAGARSFAKQQSSATSYAGASWPSAGEIPPPPQFDTPPEPQATLTICANCGTAISRAARFCNKCGSRINAG